MRKVQPEERLRILTEKLRPLRWLEGRRPSCPGWSRKRP